MKDEEVLVLFGLAIGKAREREQTHQTRCAEAYWRAERQSSLLRYESEAPRTTATSNDFQGGKHY